MQVDDGYYGEDVVVAAHLSRARRLTQSRGLEELTSIIRRKDSARGRLSGDNTVKLPRRGRGNLCLVHLGVGTR